MANEAAKVTLLQHSPTWVFTLPAVDKIAMALLAVLPDADLFKTIAQGGDRPYRDLHPASLAAAFGYTNASWT